MQMAQKKTREIRALKIKSLRSLIADQAFLGETLTPSHDLNVDKPTLGAMPLSFP